MNPLLLFYRNENEREAVKAFMIQQLGEMTVEMAFEGKPVTGIQEARQLVDKMFNRLEERYSEKKEVQFPSTR